MWLFVELLELEGSRDQTCTDESANPQAYLVGLSEAQ